MSRDDPKPLSVDPAVLPAASSPSPLGRPPATEIVAVEVLNAAGERKGTFAYGDSLRVRVDVEFHEDNAAPCFGIQIKSTDDIILWTSTTQLMGVAPLPGAAGTRASYEWRMRANFGGSRYVIAIGAGDVRSGQYLRHSRMHYAAHFDVLPEPRRGSGWIEPEATFSANEAAIPVAARVS